MQTYTSKYTSVNSKRVPYIFHHINLKKFIGGRLLDYGSGKLNPETFYIVSGEGIKYLPYDPYWMSEIANSRAMNLYPTVVVCSNLLNVLKEDYLVKDIHDYIRGLKVPYFIKIYEGDKSERGRKTKEDCWQRNEKTKSYLYPDEIIYKGIITMPKYKDYII